jgi:putative tricarboxylic transport membrane protein
MRAYRSQGCHPARLLPVLAAAMLVASAPAAVAQPAWKPQKPLEIIAASAPGGGTDKTARLIQRIIQERQLAEVASAVVNKSGGGGAMSLTYLKQHGGDAHFVNIASAVLLTNHISGRSTFSYADFTPIALLNSEYVTLAVKSDSPVQNVKDLVARLGKDPGSLSFAVGTSLGGANHVTAAAVARAAGADPKKLRTVVFKSSAESAVAALGGHVDVMASSASLVLPHVRSGAMRMLAVAAPRRLGGAMAAVPTLKEQGVDVEVDNFHVMLGPAGMSAAQVAWWDEVMGRVTQTDEWKKDRESSLVESTYMNSRDTRKYLDTQHTELKALLTEAGLVK